MPEYVIHIGPYKTGSSYLQAGLAENSVLLEAAGIHVAAVWSDHFLNPSQSGLTQGLTEEGLPATRLIFDAWRQSDWRKIVISCEELSTLSPVEVRMLKDLTADASVSIVYYIRRWSELLASAWQEYVKQGSTLQLVEVLVHNLRDAARSRIINIDLSLRSFATVFGRSALKLVPYSNLMDEGADIFAGFVASFLDEAAVVSPRSLIMNASFGPEKIELLRVFNCMEQDPGGDRTRRLIRFLELEHGPAPAMALMEYLKGFSKTIEIADDDAAVREVVAGNHAAYRDCALPPMPDSGFYQPRSSKLTFIRPDYGLTPGFAEAARQLRQDLLALEGLA